MEEVTPSLLDDFDSSYDREWLDGFNRGHSFLDLEASPDLLPLNFGRLGSLSLASPRSSLLTVRDDTDDRPAYTSQDHVKNYLRSPNYHRSPSIDESLDDFDRDRSPSPVSFPLNYNYYCLGCPSFADPQVPIVNNDINGKPFSLLDSSASPHILATERMLTSSPEPVIEVQSQTVHVLLDDKKERLKNILHSIFKAVKLYKELLSVSKVDAQKILDGFQLLLDNDYFPDRGQLIAAMRRLSERTQLYPSRFILEGPSPAAAAEPVTSGSFADIYKVIYRDEELCYKVIRVYQKTQVEHIAKVYAREVILWGQLSHKNILPLYGLIKFKSGSRISLVSRWASNGNLKDYLAEHPEANRLLLCSDTAAGVGYLHENKIVHGDLKGLNVLIDSSGRACIGDFGISSVTDPQILSWTSQSTIASQGGTVRFQAPELLLGSQGTKKIHNSKESDVFAWGSVCYEIFTGCLPFHETPNLANVILSIMQGKIPTRPIDDDASWTKHGLSNSMWELMEDCWNFEPSKRPDITSVIRRLAPEQPPDLRLPGEWAKTAMRFRNAQDNIDLLPSLKELESLLSSVVFRIKRDEH